MAHLRIKSLVLSFDKQLHEFQLQRGGFSF